MKSGWTMVQGQRVLLADYSQFGMDAKAVKVEMDHVVQLAGQEPSNSVLTLTDVRGTRGTPEIFGLMKETASKIQPYARRRAVVGVTGVQRTFLDLVNSLSRNKPFELFDDLETARDWLVRGS